MRNGRKCDGHRTRVRPLRPLSLWKCHRGRGVEEQECRENGALFRQTNERAIGARQELPVEKPRVISLTIRPVFGELRRRAPPPRRMRSGKHPGCSPARRPTDAAYRVEKRTVGHDEGREEKWTELGVAKYFTLRPATRTTRPGQAPVAPARYGLEPHSAGWLPSLLEHVRDDLLGCDAFGVGGEIR